MAVNFPNNPSIGDVHVVGFITWRWNGYAWKKVPEPSEKIQAQDTKVECIDTGTNGFVQIDTNGSERIRIGPVGQIGLPGTNYGTQGQVLTSQGPSAQPTWQNQTGGGGGGSSDKIFEGDTDVETIDTGTNGRIVARTNNLERLRITSDGKVGIGTDNPGFKVDVDYSGGEEGIRILNRNVDTGATSMLRFGNDENLNSAFLQLNSSGYQSVGGPNNIVLGHGLNRSIVFSTNGLERVHIKGDGKVGIGSTNPSKEVDIKGDVNVVGVTSFFDDVFFPEKVQGASGFERLSGVFYDASDASLKFNGTADIQFGADDPFGRHLTIFSTTSAAPAPTAGNGVVIRAKDTGLNIQCGVGSEIIIGGTSASTFGILKIDPEAGITTIRNSLHVGNVSTITLDGLTGIVTASKFVGSVQATGSDFTGNVTISGNLSVGGVLTYEDVTNVDAIGIITARNGIQVTGGDFAIKDYIKHIGDLNTRFGFPENDTFTVDTNGTERLRINNAGIATFAVGIATFTNDVVIGNDLFLQKKDNAICKITGDGNLNLYADALVRFYESDNDNLMFTFDVNTVNNDARLIMENDTDTFFNHPASNQLGFTAGGTETLRIEAGKLGINATSPNSALDVRNSSGTNPLLSLHHSNIDTEGEVIRIGRTDSDDIRYHSIKSRHSATAASNFINFKLHDGSGDPFTNQEEVLRIQGNKKVGINTDNATATLDIIKLTSLNVPVLNLSGGTPTSGDLTVESGQHLQIGHWNRTSSTFTERFRIGSQGQLGISGENYGTSGQVIVSQGASSPPVWVSLTDDMLTAEEVQDIVGAMFSGNTETRIAATYQDSDGTIDLVVDDMTSDNNTTYTISTVDGDSSNQEKLRLTGSDATDDDVVFEAGTGLSIARSGDKITFTNTDPGSGTNTFIGLTDTPSSYTANKTLKVNSAGNAVIFADDNDTTYLLKARQVAGSNNDPDLFLDASSGTDDSIRLVGGLNMTITRNNDGQITFDSTDTDTTVTVNNNADNRIITGSDTANTLNAETNLTYDGSVLKINGTGQALLTLRTTNNTSDRGIAFQNSGNSYVASINVEDAGSDTGDLVFHVDDSNNSDLSLVEERLRIRKTGAFGLNGANYGTSGQVLTSQGSGSAPTWTTPDTEVDKTYL